jgi:hypothetical protein
MAEKLRQDAGLSTTASVVNLCIFTWFVLRSSPAPRTLSTSVIPNYVRPYLPEPRRCTPPGLILFEPRASARLFFGERKMLRRV